MKTQAHTYMYVVFICMYFFALAVTKFLWMDMLLGNYEIIFT